MLRDRIRYRLWRAQVALARALTPRYEIRCRGLRLRLLCDNSITYYRWATYETKEPETLDWIDHRVADKDVLFDVGANIGVYTIYAALRHPRATIVAIEPEYSNLHVLRDHLLDNGIGDRVQVYSLALAARTGPSKLHIQDLRPGAALHTESAMDIRQTRSGDAVVWREGVWSMRLDDLCAAVGLVPDALKLDVDGTECEILEGGLDALRHVRTLLLEIPLDAGEAARCERLLLEAGLHRIGAYAAPSSTNELWERSRA